MKKVILLFVCIGTMYCSFAQETPSETSKPVLTKQEYFQKSKGQRTAAIVLISVGGAITVAGIAVAAGDATEDLGNIFDPNAETNKHETLSIALIITGVAAMLGSVGLFVSAHKNKKRALSVSFINEVAPQFQKGMVFYRSVPSLTLKISL
jgi:hypothetical protein